MIKAAVTKGDKMIVCMFVGSQISCHELHKQLDFF